MSEVQLRQPVSHGSQTTVVSLQNVPAGHPPHGGKMVVHDPSDCLTPPVIQSQAPVVVFRNAPDLQVMQAFGSFGMVHVAHVGSQSRPEQLPLGSREEPSGHTQGP